MEITLNGRVCITAFKPTLSIIYNVILPTCYIFFFLNDPATPEIYPFPLPDALPIPVRKVVGELLLDLAALPQQEMVPPLDGFRIPLARQEGKQQKVQVSPAVRPPQLGGGMDGDRDQIGRAHV